MCQELLQQLGGGSPLDCVRHLQRNQTTCLGLCQQSIIKDAPKNEHPLAGKGMEAERGQEEVKDCLPLTHLVEFPALPSSSLTSLPRTQCSLGERQKKPVSETKLMASSIPPSLSTSTLFASYFLFWSRNIFFHSSHQGFIE